MVNELQFNVLRFTGRASSAAELSVLLQTLQDQRSRYTANPAEAAKLIKVGETKPDPSLAPIEVAAMTITTQMILNSDAVIWKR